MKINSRWKSYKKQTLARYTSKSSFDLEAVKQEINGFIDRGAFKFVEKTRY